MYAFRIQVRSVYRHVPVKGIPNCQPSKLLRIAEGDDYCRQNDVWNDYVG